MVNGVYGKNVVYYENNLKHIDTVFNITKGRLYVVLYSGSTKYKKSTAYLTTVGRR